MIGQAIELDETPVSLGRRTTLEQVVSARETGSEVVYIHVYDQEETPTGSDVPVLSLPVPADETRSYSPFYTARLILWVAASTDHLAGLTAPAGDLEVSLTTR